MEFQWDDDNRNHLALHGIEPEETEQVMRSDPFELMIQDHPTDIVRIRYVGETKVGRILVVMITWRSEFMRIITAWDAPKGVKKSYLAERAREYGQDT